MTRNSERGGGVLKRCVFVSQERDTKESPHSLGAIVLKELPLMVVNLGWGATSNPVSDDLCVLAGI